MVDSKRQRRLAYEVLDHDPTQEDVRKFFKKVSLMLSHRNLSVYGITTDGSPLYPEVIKNVFPGVPHQVCEFHVIREIIKDVLKALAKIRKAMAAKVPKRGRGRPRRGEERQVQRTKRMQDRISELFTNRHLFVQHGLNKTECQKIAKFYRGRPDLKSLRELMDEVYRLFDRRCRTDTALEKLAKLRRKLSRFKHLGKVLSKLHSPNIEKALTFLDDKMLEATSNSVERANRRHRKMQKSVYRVRTQTSITHRIALDMLRDRDIKQRPIVLNALREARHINATRSQDKEDKAVSDNNDIQKNLVGLELVSIGHYNENVPDLFKYGGLSEHLAAQSIMPPLLEKCKQNPD